MQLPFNDIVEKARLNQPDHRRGDTFGRFVVKCGDVYLHVIACDGQGMRDHFPDTKYEWDHVSVSLRDRCPTWDEMSYIKSLFWDDEETVIQLHPPKSQYVNHMQYCLHLWKPLGFDIPLPPKEAV